ncbi:hypothetical protein IT084_08135 [Desulfallas sp. Bu1-1]|uniref:hypothetical protein n=1 Tax=Desulfallas sp. Bu1-1 TaxID=2787620 RepID=UPI00189D3A1B|nr:hypothetical protein [Desulfallas sp. Bu1-1]MBF7082942.1 hypothetical protein [Desulfallas sp. Bu1-1]
MEIIKIPEILTFTTPRGVIARKLLDRDGLVLMNLLLKPGEVIFFIITYHVEHVYLSLVGLYEIYYAVFSLVPVWNASG